MKFNKQTLNPFFRIKFNPHCWYMEYHSGIRIHFTIAIFINNYPIFVIAKFDDPHSDEDWIHNIISIFGLEISWGMITI